MNPTFLSIPHGKVPLSIPKVPQTSKFNSPGIAEAAAIGVYVSK